MCCFALFAFGFVFGRFLVVTVYPPFLTDCSCTPTSLRWLLRGGSLGAALYFYAELRCDAVMCYALVQRCDVLFASLRRCVTCCVATFLLDHYWEWASELMLMSLVHGSLPE